ncbi:hypothetical protein GCM10017083_05620 [Thalassobaculum fulvum]|uniref:Uncharacterized protein n=2 Tax=Thalassobaculum fulvum TaxID=1633335 RepID=A0A918XNA0_9PROT|nr:hypothetical protein GCM10017083_05620 [Thalassobaculum fulvum]
MRTAVAATPGAGDARKWTVNVYPLRRAYAFWLIRLYVEPGHPEPGPAAPRWAGDTVRRMVADQGGGGVHPDPVRVGVGQQPALDAQSRPLEPAAFADSTGETEVFLVCKE